MASINPTSTVKLFTGIPLDPTYSDTLYFADMSAQLSYFNTLTPAAVFSSQMYQRVTDGVFEANLAIDTIYNVNYMMFHNTSFENKWFFAFVTKVEYINNHNTRIHFTLDVMQTWMFNITVKRSFIERQHSITDTFGSSMTPEPVALGEYVFDDYDELTDLYDRYAIVIMLVDSGYDTGVYGGVYSGAHLMAIDAETTTPTGGAPANIKSEVLNRYYQTPEVITGMYMCPLKLLPIRSGQQTQEDSYDQVAAVPSGSPVGYSTITRTAGNQLTSIGGYTPKNKKLFTYPYNFYHVDNGDGAGLDVRYEFFTNYTPAFRIEGCITPPVQLRLTPYNYKGSGTGGTGQTDTADLRSEFITIGGFPVCSWNYDTFRAWVAQNSVPMEISAGMAIGGIALAGMTGGASLAFTAGVGALTTAVNAVSQGIQASQKADVCKGNVNSGNVDFANKKLSFFGARCHITPEYAEVIDNFFTMFGYAYNKIGIPNISSRPHWNYVKTAGVKIIGSCPADDLEKIKSIYDNGVTFWKSAAEVGNYQLDNSPPATTPPTPTPTTP